MYRWEVHNVLLKLTLISENYFYGNYSRQIRKIHGNKCSICPQQKISTAWFFPPQHLAMTFPKVHDPFVPLTLGQFILGHYPENIQSWTLLGIFEISCSPVILAGRSELQKVELQEHSPAWSKLNTFVGYFRYTVSQSCKLIIPTCASLAELFSRATIKSPLICTQIRT